MERLKRNYLYDVEHLVQVYRPLTYETTLCLTNGTFTERGLELTAYVCFDSTNGDIFTIRAKFREDNTLENISKNTANKIREVEFEYAGKVFTLNADEVYRLCNKKDISNIDYITIE